MQDGAIHKWELSRNLEHLANTPNADRVGNNAAFVCPMCQHVYIVSNGKNVGEAQKEQGSRPCPHCGESVAEVTLGGLANPGGGRAWIVWPVKKKTG